MKWSDVENGVWNIASEKREKGNANELKLPKMALDIIEAQPHFALTHMCSLLGVALNSRTTRLLKPCLSPSCPRCRNGNCTTYAEPPDY